MRRVFHLLPEGEAFSEFHGGAISRWVANVLREDPAGVVVAPATDASWQYPCETIRSQRWMQVYGLLQRLTRKRTPWVLRRRLLQMGFRSTIARLKRGDVVWVHNRPEFASAICDSVHRAGAQVVLHMHNLHLVTAKRRIVEELHADRIVYVSEYLQQASSPALHEPTSSAVLYNGADGALFTPQAGRKRDGERTMRVLFAGRVVGEKGPHVFAAALAQLDRQGISVEGVIVGGAEFGDALPSQYMRDLMRNAPRNLRFEPYCTGEKLARLFQQADVFCLPSVWDDPFPLAPLEAMAAGLPVVATYSGGIPEALFDGGGILVERNSVEALAEALAQLAANPRLRQRLSDEALASFRQHFRWAHVRANYAAIVEQLAHA